MNQPFGRKEKQIFVKRLMNLGQGITYEQAVNMIDKCSNDLEAEELIENKTVINLTYEDVNNKISVSSVKNKDEKKEKLLTIGLNISNPINLGKKGDCFTLMNDVIANYSGMPIKIKKGTQIKLKEINENEAIFSMEE